MFKLLKGDRLEMMNQGLISLNKHFYVWTGALE